MSTFIPPFFTAVAQTPLLLQVAKLRNWHDRMMGFNKGRGFEMTFIPLPDEPCNWDYKTYKEGALTPDEVVDDSTYDTNSVPRTFDKFTGIVVGLTDMFGDFIAITFYDTSERTPTQTYKQALEKLKAAKFLTPPDAFTPVGDGWNVLEKFANENIAVTPREDYGSWLILPAQPRLAESAHRKGLCMLAHLVYGIQGEAPQEPAAPTQAVEELDVTTTPEDVPPPSYRRVYTFLLSGRFDKPKSDITKELEAAGHTVVSTYSSEVEIVMVASANSRTESANKAREEGKILILPSQLASYIPNEETP
jgi:hypothetical protein